MARTPNLSEVKQMMKAMWTAGDFGRIAEFMEKPGEEFVERLDLKPEMKVLDVGCGSGNQSIPAARKAAKVAAVDIAPNLLAQTAERANREHLDVVVHEADAEALPFPDGEFDVVLSMFAAIFAPRPDVVAAELLRVCRPGGLIAMGNWPLDSFVAKQTTVLHKFAPPPEGVPNPMLWGEEEVVRARFAACAEVKATRRPIVFDLPFGPEEAEEHFRRHIGPAQVAFARLNDGERQQFVAEMKEQWRRENRGDDGRTVVETEYLEVYARPSALGQERSGGRSR